MSEYAFVIYPHEHKAIVSKFVDELQDRRVNVWFNSQIEECDWYWDDLLMEALKSSSVVFVFISKHFVEAAYCSREFDAAVEGGKTIIPVLLEEGVVLPEQMETKLNQSKHLSPLDCSHGYIYSVIDQICEDDVIKAISTDSYCSSGYGPKRRIYSKDEMCDHRVFNSIKNHPKYGNEQEFLRVKVPGSESYETCRRLFLKPGREYEFEIIVHNCADYDLNQTGVAIANSVIASVKLPEMIRPSKIGEVVALIGSSTTKPPAVWDSITLCCDRPIFIKFLHGTAVFERAYDGFRRVMPTDLFSDLGTYISDFTRSGEPLVPGGDKYAGRILFKIRTSEDCVRIGYNKSILSEEGQVLDTVKVGEVFTVKTVFTYNGDHNLRSTCFSDVFPEGMELIPGTTVLTNGANPDGLKMKDIIDQNGFNTGLYGPGASATITYKARFTSGFGVKVISGVVDHRAGFYSFDTQVNVVE